MKKCIILLTIIATLCITSCKSNEEKANELIRAELSKTLYDFDSYQPVETIVKENQQQYYNAIAASIIRIRETSKYLEKFKFEVENRIERFS